MAGRHRVVDHIVKYLAASGVDFIFGVDGANIEDLYYAAFFRDDITAVLAKHEFSAATMADGYSRSGAGLRRRGRDLGRRVPEHPCRDWARALASRVPVLALIGKTPTTLDGLGSFQDTSGRNGALDAQALFSAVSVFCRRIVTPQDIVSALPEAVARPVPVAPRSCCCPRTFSRPRSASTAVSAGSSRPGPSSVIRRRYGCACTARTALRIRREHRSRCEGFVQTGARTSR